MNRLASMLLVGAMSLMTASAQSQADCTDRQKWVPQVQSCQLCDPYLRKQTFDVGGTVYEYCGTDTCADEAAASKTYIIQTDGRCYQCPAGESATEAKVEAGNKMTRCSGGSTGNPTTSGGGATCTGCRQYTDQNGRCQTCNTQQTVAGQVGSQYCA